MIVGTGVDACEISRIRQVQERHGQRFLRRIFTPAEMQYCESKRYAAAASFAARFAAKEATMKALGTGLAKQVRWQDVEVIHLASGRPMIELHGKAADQAALMGVSAIHLSLSHGREVAVASVILESGSRS